jgi:hypothetical protein
MTRAQIAWTIFWIVVGGFFLRSCYLHNSKKSDIPLSPLQRAQTQPKKSAPPKKAIFEIQDYKIQSADSYRFSVAFRVVNTGKRAADKVRFKLHPWVGGGLIPDRGKDIDLKDPILQAGKEAFIGRLEPGQSASFSMEFYQANGYYPGVLFGSSGGDVQMFEFFYVDAP